MNDDPVWVWWVGTIVCALGALVCSSPLVRLLLLAITAYGALHLAGGTP